MGRRGFMVLGLCVVGCGRIDFDVRSDGASADTGDAAPAPNYAFVTSTTQLPTTFGSDLSGADAICNMRAMEAGLPGTYVAWLSTTSIAARDRIASARGWIRTDGKPFTDRVADLVASRVWYPLDRDEHGTVVNSFVETGTNDTGGMLPNCSDYTDAGQTIYFGVTVATAHGWTHESNIACTMPGRIYCFGIDRSVPVALPAPVTGRIAFLTAGNLIPDAGGLTTADNLCASEATAAGLTGITFRALLATSTSTAISRVSLSGPTWVRTDGLPLADTPTDLRIGNMTTSLNVTAAGAYRIANAFTGAVDLSTPTTGGAVSCSDWTSTAGNGSIGLPSYISSDFFYDASQVGACGPGKPIYCFEQ